VSRLPVPASLRRVLVVKPSSLGDIVHALPLLPLLRAHLPPDARIRWLVNRSWAPLLENHPLLDGLVVFPREEMRGWQAPARFLSWARQPSAWRPDLALDVQGLFRSLLLARSCRPSHLLGYSDAREGAVYGFDARIDVRQARSPHAVDRYLTLADAFGWTRPDAATVQFPLPPGTQPGPGITDRLPDRFLVLHPFSRGAGKSLAVPQVERFCAECPGLPVVLVGRADPAVAGHRWPSSTLNLLNATSLPELLWILRRAAWTISVDSGPMHLAAAVSDRVLSLHTWSDPLKVGPYPDTAYAWREGRIRTMAEWRRDGAGPALRRGDGAFPDTGIEDLVAFVEKVNPAATRPRPDHGDPSPA